MGLENSGANNALAALGALCWSLQLVPQIWKSWRRKDTAGLSTLMLLLWYVSGVFLGAYCITSNLSIPLIIQPQAFCFFSSIAWAQCLHYDSHWSTFWSISIVFISWAVGGGIEAGLAFACKHLQDRGNEHMNFALGVLAAIFVAGGLLPQYYEIWRFKAVVGISLIFLFVDFMGGVFSVLSLIFAPPPFDVLASISYSAVVVLELGIFILVPILNPRYRRKQREKEEREMQVAGRTGETTVVGGGGPDGRTDAGVKPDESGLDTVVSDEEAAREGGFGYLGQRLEGFGGTGQPSRRPRE
ncbi:hypothetical protein JCM10212_000027 [Sporobolomyces blumeae]